MNYNKIHNQITNYLKQNLKFIDFFRKNPSKEYIIQLRNDGTKSCKFKDEIEFVMNVRLFVFKKDDNIIDINKAEIPNDDKLFEMNIQILNEDFNKEEFNEYRFIFKP